MTQQHRDVAATLERLYPPLIGGPGWEDVLDRLAAETASAATSGVPPVGVQRPRLVRRRLIAPLAAVLATVVVVAAPAFAFSPKLRELVGLTTSTRGPAFVARVTSVTVHGPDTRPGTLVTVTFTVGEQGKPPGTGVPRGSTFEVFLTRRWNEGAPASGANGRYHSTVRLGPGRGIGGILIGGFMPSKGPKLLNGGFWIYTVIDLPE